MEKYIKNLKDMKNHYKNDDNFISFIYLEKNIDNIIYILQNEDSYFNRNEIEFIKIINNNNIINIKKILGEIVEDFDMDDIMYNINKYNNIRFYYIYEKINIKKYRYFFKALGEFNKMEYQQCINILEKNFLEESNHYIGLCYQYLKNFKKAIEYFKKSKYSKSKYQICETLWSKNNNVKLNKYVKYYSYHHYHPYMFKMIKNIYLKKKYKLKYYTKKYDKINMYFNINKIIKNILFN